MAKSTLTRDLALSVATGRAFLGRPTAQGAVIYLVLEEKRSEVCKHFRDMGATEGEEIAIFASTAPAGALAQIRAVINAQKPTLLIINPLIRFMRLRYGRLCAGHPNPRTALGLGARHRDACAVRAP